MRPVLSYSIGIFVLKPLMRHVILLIDWLRIHMNLKLVVLILTSLLMPLLCVKFVIVLIMTALLVPIIFLMASLLGLVV